MFKKKCQYCKSKIEKKYDFCPFCGKELTNPVQHKEDYGILGKNDVEEFMPGFSASPIIDKLFKSAMKMLEKQMRGIQNESNQQKRQNINTNPFGNVDVQFFVNGKKINSSNIIQQTVPKKQKPQIEISKETIEQLAKLPRKEPKFKMKRLATKIVYELDVPGVTNINNVLINQLENSIEIKAIAKTKVYSKTLHVNLPIIRYTLDNENLILELQVK